ncbi:hypothetical protein ACMU_03050 [Actibacterium mucosum KCTC 23349]|uniref:Glycosyltransferase n=1 Tax=Actibacterium mucosum KCTC 23349 TaxID=1454373 RepID=A0A037ZN44_9RHOB|nr:hypothetical protein [Actibacterium mucosum]KAJ57499.1 hypothetical protein ACMU_03050 [Actibacterium mucosum KCTC 23349]
MKPANVHAVLIAWNDKIEDARAIGAQLLPVVDRLTTVWSDPGHKDQTGPGEWIRTSHKEFFGPKMAVALEACHGDILLLVHADTHCDDWAKLVAACRNDFANLSELGVWSPVIRDTYWHQEDVLVGSIRGHPQLRSIAQTDGIVTAFGPHVVERLKALDCRSNNLGWGIDHAAVAFTRVSNGFVVQNQDVVVLHELGSGYDNSEASVQMRRFLGQLTPQEQDQIAMLEGYAQRQRGYRLNLRKRLKRRLRKLLKKS